MPLSKIPGLVLHLPMNEQSGVVANDNSRYGNDGSLGGGDAAKMPVWVEHGLRFDGTDDYVDCGNDASLNITSEITLSAWVNIKEVQSEVFSSILGKWETASDNRCYWLAFDKSFEEIRFFLSTDGIDYGNRVGYTPSFDTWESITATYDGVTMRIYSNGVEQSTLGTPITIHSEPTKEMVIGGRKDGVDRCIESPIDDVRIYNRALSASGVMDLYNERKHLYV